MQSAPNDESMNSGPDPADESPEARARRLGESLRGLLKEEMAEYGGAEGFIRWVRGYDEEDSERDASSDPK
jgi:hypothetical protein